LSSSIYLQIQKNVVQLVTDSLRNMYWVGSSNSYLNAGIYGKDKYYMRRVYLNKDKWTLI